MVITLGQPLANAMPVSPRAGNPIQPNINNGFSAKLEAVPKTRILRIEIFDSEL